MKQLHAHGTGCPQENLNEISHFAFDSVCHVLTGFAVVLIEVLSVFVVPVLQYRSSLSVRGFLVSVYFFPAYHLYLSSPRSRSAFEFDVAAFPHCLPLYPWKFLVNEQQQKLQHPSQHLTV
jgi:hypothetical protein